MLFFGCITWGMIGCSTEKEIRTELNSGWQFRQRDSGTWLPATVPGTVHTDLLASGKIEDPFYRMNELQLQWIDKKDWEYRTEFTVSEEIGKKVNQRITYTGLDTYADVYLNGEKLGNTDNMFRTWRFDVEGKLKVGRNELRIVFASPTLKGREEMERYGRRYNSCGFMYATDRDGHVYNKEYYKDDNGEKHYLTDEGGALHFYDDQTDNYTQKNYQLLFNHNFTSQWNLNIGLHYTKGDGYYQEYKGERSLTEYGMSPFEYNGGKIEVSDLIRKKAMDNWFGGGIFSVSYKADRLHASLGGALNRYDGDHFGKVLWVKNYIGELNPDHDYYRNNATKNDGNIYLKANYELVSGLSAYLDLQYRHINYKINGLNDKYNWTATTPGMQKLDIDEDFDFFNPKAGLSWQIDRNHRLYGSFSVAHKEPTRNNYTDGYFTEHPKAERLFDYELGYTFANSWLHAGANFYYMDYKDQLVLTGELNEIGEAMASNVPDSYRTGIELMAGIKLDCGLQWDINATLSKNRVQNFTETLFENEEAGSEAWVIKHGDTPIAFSPDFILNNRFGYTFKGFEASLQSQYISKQYMSNAKQEECTLDAYFVSNLNLSYTFKLPKVKSVTIGCTIYNLFNEEYENNGYAGSGYYLDDNGGKVRYNYAGYAAQAGTNVLGHIAINF